MTKGRTHGRAIYGFRKAPTEDYHRSGRVHLHLFATRLCGPQLDKNCESGVPIFQGRTQWNSDQEKMWHPIEEEYATRFERESVAFSKCATVVRKRD